MGHAAKEAAAAPLCPMAEPALETGLAVEASSKPAPAIRYAEKDRKSTCSFADRVAQSAVAMVRKQAAAAGVEYKQTVAAAVVLLYKPKGGEARFSTVSIGVGTKFMKAAALADDLFGACVRDCHAEVLARRGFHRYLAAQLLGCLRGEPSIFLPPAHAGERFRLVEGMSFHLYSSSQPCGNASVKRWAKPSAGKRFPEMRESEFPAEHHERLKPPMHARLEGMFALSVKREPKEQAAAMPSATPPPPGGETAMVASAGLSTPVPPRRPAAAAASLLAAVDELVSPAATSSAHRGGGGRSGGRGTSTKEALMLARSSQEAIVASGTAPVDSGEGCLLSCSDKIARWNAIGLQGALLAHFLGPLYLKTVTVGRRFSRPHAERALCCRLQDFEPQNRGLSELAHPYRIHHPAMLCTAVKLDQSYISTEGEEGRHADFGEARCLCWAAGERQPELIDGASGTLEPSGCSARVAPLPKLEHFLELWREAHAARLAPTSLAALPPSEEEVRAALRGEAAPSSGSSSAGAALPAAPRELAYRLLKQRLTDPEYAVARGLLLERPEFSCWRLAKRHTEIPGRTPALFPHVQAAEAAVQPASPARRALPVVGISPPPSPAPPESPDDG